MLIPHIGDLADRERRNKVYGVVVGVVTDNKDPQGWYRVKVRFPWLPNGGKEGEQSHWCRCTTIGAGGGRGLFCLPEVNDEVLVAFEHGDMARGYVVGSLWNKDSKSFADNKGGKNDNRTFMSRSGHKLDFNDASTGTVTLVSKGGNKVLLDDGGQVVVIDGAGSNYLVFNSGGITLETTSGDMLLKASGTVNIQANEIVTQSAGDTVMQVGACFGMQSRGDFMLMGGASGAIQASSTLIIRGATVNIN